MTVTVDDGPAPPPTAETGRSRRLKRLLLEVAAVLVGAIWGKVLLRPSVGDYPLHWDFGHRFLSGRYLYEEGHDPYPPFWGMACASLTILPRLAGQAIVFPAGLAALAALTAVLDRLARPSLPLAEGARFQSAAIAMALASRFLIRELPECGPNLAMVTLAWVAIACWRARREVIGAACLGLAIALKCTPALFVPYFAIKRQGRMAFLTTAFAALFTVAPAAWMGPSSFARHLRTWASRSGRGLGEPDPSVGVLGQDEVKNHALRPVLARLLMDLPPGHLGRVDSSWRARGLDLPPAVAGVVIKAAIALSLAAVAWTFRRPARDRDDPAILWEGAAVSILILLLSPLTWRQHCVGAYPACFLLARSALSPVGLPRWMLGLLGAFAVAVDGLDRWVVGREATLVLDSWGVTTWALTLLLALTLAGRARTERERARASTLAGFRPD